MFNIRLATSAFVLMLIVLPVNGRCQSLSEAYAAALSHDPDHAAAIAERDAMQENKVLASSLFRPKVQFQGSVGYSRITSDVDSVSTVLPDKVSGGGGGVLIGVEQPVIDGAARAQARQLQASARAGDARFQASRQQLALRVTQAYLGVLRTNGLLATLKAEEASARREQQAAQARFDAGRAKITDVREAQARADSIAAQLVSARMQQGIAASRFRELTGLDAGGLYRISSDLVP
jgi:outer membrane protein